VHVADAAVPALMKNVMTGFCWGQHDDSVTFIFWDGVIFMTFSLY
jgi:hypothetical protein